MVQGATFDVFLSYSRSDAAAAGRLVEALRARGLKVFFDRDYLTPGQQWPELLETHLRQCRSAAICLGPAGLGAWQKREQYVALDRQVQEGAFPVIPVLLPGAKDPPLGFLRLDTWVDFKAGLDNEAALDLLANAIRGQAPRAVDAGLPDPRAALCPYRGLEPFREEDAPFFVGREAFTKVLIDKIGERPLVGVVGASGSGKSSVVLAGLVPALRRRADGRVWEIAVMRPGQYPLRQLAAAFLPPDPGLDEFARIATLKERAGQLASGKVTLTDVIDAALVKQQGTDRFLLIIDQWEELYTLARDSDAASERDDFMRVLFAGVDAKRLSVVLTLRGDFYGRALQDRALGDRLQDAVVNVSPMVHDELRRVIDEPAAKVGLKFESGLVDQILADVGNEPGNLPLLEFLLKELWDRRTADQRLTFAAYGDTGGVRRAIAERAEAELAKLSPDQQAAARRFMIRLVTPGEGQADTRARIPIPQGNEAIRAVIERFAQARLLTTRFDQASGREVVEVGHEALIREWSTLKGWVDADREFLRTVQRVKMAMQVWQEETGDKSQRLLPPGRPLEEARELLARERAEVDDIRPFIEASIAQDDARVAAQQRETEERQRKEYRALKRRMAIGAAAAILVIIGFVYLQTQSLARLADAEARSIWSRLVLNEELEPYELDELWRLAQAEPIGLESAWRRVTGIPSRFEAFWGQLPGDVGLTLKLGKRPGVVVRTAGIDDGRRSNTVRDALLQGFAQTGDLDQHAALAKAIAALPQGLTQEQAASLFNVLVQPARAGADRHANEADAASLADVVEALAPALTPDQAIDGVNVLLAALRTRNSADRVQLASAMARLRSKVRSEPELAVSYLREQLSSSKKEDQPYMAAALARMIDPTRAESSPVIDAIIGIFHNVQDIREFGALGDALRTLAPKLNTKQATDVASFCLDVFVTKTGPMQTTCAELIGILPIELSAEQAATVFAPFEATRWTNQRAVLARMIIALAPKLHPEQLKPALKLALDDIESVTRQEVRPRAIYRGLLRRIATEPALFDFVLGLFVERTSFTSHAALTNLLAEAAPVLDTSRATAAAKTILTVFPQRYPHGARLSPTHALAVLAPKLEPDLARSAADFIIQAFVAARDPNNRATMAGFIAELPPGVRPESVAVTIDASIASFERTTGVARAAAAREAAALAPRMSAAQSARTRDAFVRALGETDDSDQRKALIQGLAQLPVALTPEQSVKALSIARAELADVGKSDEAVEWIQPVDRLLASRPEQEQGAAMIDILKYPAVGGPPSETVIADLRTRFADAPAQGAPLRDVVAWLKARFPALTPKFAEPAVRPTGS